MSDESVPLTEQSNPKSKDLELLSTPELLHLINDEDRQAAWAVEREIQAISTAVDAIAERLQKGGRLHYFGAGTSGRIGVLDAAEMGPTFSANNLIVAHIAGGASAMQQAVEGAEDDARAGAAEAQHALGEKDAVIGISASGTTQYVIGALLEAASRNTLTVCITNNSQSPLAQLVKIPIVLRTGQEVIAGSTRMKAAVAQKMALTMVSTAVMVKLGKVYCGLMVDMAATNTKLRARARRLVARLTAAGEDAVKRALEQSNYHVKTAVVMLWCGCDSAKAEAKLKESGDELRLVQRSISRGPV